MWSDCCSIYVLISKKKLNTLVTVNFTTFQRKHIFFNTVVHVKIVQALSSLQALPPPPPQTWIFYTKIFKLCPSPESIQSFFSQGSTSVQKRSVEDTQLNLPTKLNSREDYKSLHTSQVRRPVTMATLTFANIVAIS